MTQLYKMNNNIGFSYRVFLISDFVLVKFSGKF